MNEITVKEAAEILKLTPRRVHQLIKDGVLPAQERGVYLIKRGDLRLAKKRRKPGRPAKRKDNGK